MSVGKVLDTSRCRMMTFLLTQPPPNLTSSLDVAGLTVPPSSRTNMGLTSLRCVVGEIAEQKAADPSIFQNFTAPTQASPLPCWETALKVVFYAAAFLLSVGGNTLVIAVVCLDKRMRSTTNILLLNLAVSDVMVAAVCMWVHLGNSITPEWPFGPFVCKVNTFCQVAVVTASVLTLAAISVERFMAVVFPLRAHWTGCTCTAITAVTWLTAGAVASPHLFVRRVYRQQWKDRLEVWCDEDWPQVYKDEDCTTWEPGRVVYYSVEGIVIYLVPVLIMIGAYSIIGVKIATKKLPGTFISSSAINQEKAKRKVIKMLVVVLVCFVVCWTPQQAMLLYDVFRPYGQVPQYVNTVKYVALYVAYFNSALNPFLYALFNHNFRRSFRDLVLMFGKTRSNKVHPDPGMSPGHWDVEKGDSGPGGTLGDTINIQTKGRPNTPADSPFSAGQHDDKTQSDDTDSSHLTSKQQMRVAEAARIASIFYDSADFPSPSTSNEFRRRSIHSF